MRIGAQPNCRACAKSKACYLTPSFLIGLSANRSGEVYINLRQPVGPWITSSQAEQIMASSSSRNNRRVQCLHCRQTLGKNRELKRHLREQHSDWRRSCPAPGCHHSAKRLYNLEKHLKKHDRCSTGIVALDRAAAVPD